MIPEGSMGYPADLDISPDSTKTHSLLYAAGYRTGRSCIRQPHCVYRLQKVGSETGKASWLAVKLYKRTYFRRWSSWIPPMRQLSEAAACSCLRDEIPSFWNRSIFRKKRERRLISRITIMLGMTVAGQKEKAPLLKIYSANGELQFAKKNWRRAMVESNYTRGRCLCAGLRPFESMSLTAGSVRRNMPLPILEILPGSKKYEYVVVDSASIRQIRLH